MATIKNKDIDNIIAKYLSGNLSNGERKKLHVWMKQSDEHKQQFSEASQLWNRMEKTKKQASGYNADEAWQRVKQDILKQEKQKRIGIRRITTFASAAAAVLLIGVFLWLQSTTGSHQIVVKDNEAAKNVELKDGSEVSLNSGSTLDYPDSFNKKNRDVTLTGEAFFEVKHMSNTPFRVNTGNVTVQVLGTSFNVNAYQKDHPIITVNSGEVQIIQNNQSVIKQLSANERAYLSPNGWVKEENTNLNFLAWKTKKFTFMDVELAEVVKQIESVYNCNIQITNKELQECRLTAVFNKEEIDDIIQTICLAFNIEAEQEDNTYVLSGTACQ